MSESRYAVILHHDPDLKETHEKVVACLSRLDPTASVRFRSLKSAKLLIVKRNTDLATARRLKKILCETGARCSIQEHDPVPSADRGGARESCEELPAAGPETNPLLEKCPHCGYQQPPTPECRACGIIIAKARPLKEPRGAGTQGRRQSPARHRSKKRIQSLIHRHAGSLEALLRRIQYPSGVRKLATWAQRVLDRLIRCAIVFVIALVLQIGLLSLGKMMWYLYLSTATGQYYLQKLPEKAEMFERIAQADSWVLGWDTTLTVLIACLLMSGAAQVLHLIRYLYDSQGIIGKLVLWFAPSIGLTGWIVSQEHPYPEYALATTLVTVPALCMLSSCLCLARTMLPEIGEFRKILAIITANREKTWGVIIKKIRIWLDATK